MNSTNTGLTSVALCVYEVW